MQKYIRDKASHIEPVAGERLEDGRAAFPYACNRSFAVRSSSIRMAIFDLRDISTGRDILVFTDDTARTCGEPIFPISLL